MDNAASRLLFILERAKKVDKKSNCAQAWAFVFDARTDPETMGFLGEFLRLVDQAGKEIIAEHPDEKDAVDYWQSRIFGGLNAASLGSGWENFINYIDATTIFSIRSHAKIINASSKKKKIEKTEIEKITNSLKKALESVNDIEIPEESRKLIARRIEQILSLLNRYQYIGQDALLDATKLLAADISLLEKEQREKVIQSTTYSQFKEAAENLAHATTIVFENPMIVHAGSHLLSLFK